MNSPSETSAPTEGTWQRLHPAMLWFEAGRILRRMLLPLIIGVFAVSRREGGPLAFIVMGSIVSAFGFVSSYLSFRYQLNADAIELREGILTRRRRTIALARISHIDTHQNALARLIGVVRLEIETEGGSEKKVAFAALSLTAAEQIRQHVGNVGSVHEEQHVVYAATLRDRVLLGATTMQAGGIVALAFVGWRFVRRLGGRDGLEASPSDGFFSGVIVFFDELYAAVSASPGSIALSIAVLLLGIWGLSIVLSMVRWYGFRIIDRGAELHQQSGVLSRSRTVIARDRIQAVEIRTSLLRNLLGLAQIAIVAAGSGGRGRSRSRIFIPMTSIERVGDYVKALWPQTGAELDWQPVHPYYRRQYIMRRLRLLIIVAVGAFALVPLSAATIAAIALAAIGLAWVSWRAAAPSFAATGFALCDGYLHIRKGAVSPQRWVVAIDRIQTVMLAQSFFQRRRGVMNVEIDVNGLANNQRITIPSVPQAQAEEMQMVLTPRGPSLEVKATSVVSLHST